jgi:hypothetical protein
MEAFVNLKKNAGAKIGAVVASLAALLVAWGLVHQNTPAPVSADTSAATTDAAPPPTTGSPAASRAKAAAPVVKKRHVRTHVS